MGVLAHLAVQRRTLGREIQKLANDGIILDKTEEGSDGLLKLNYRLCVPDVDGLKKAIMEEAHSSRPTDKVRAFSTNKDDRIRRARPSVHSAFLAGISEKIRYQGQFEHRFPSTDQCYQASIGMAPYVALYGRRCRSLVGWFEPANVSLIGPEFVCEALEKVQLIRERLKVAQSR
nr:uncharacterized protein LOC104098845 [Nicotiana tomentosiformis]